MDLYSIGEMVIDFTPGAEPASYIRNAGGAPANLAIGVTRNGFDASMCCSVGDDDFGRFLLDTLKENGVRVVKPELCENAVTTMAFVTLKEDGDRSFTFARKPGADMFIEERDVRPEDIEDTTIVHAGSCSLSASPCAEATRKALQLGHEMGKLVSFDVNYRDVMWNGDSAACANAVFEILPFVDLLKVSDAEVDMMGSEAGIPALMEKYGLRAVVETLGGEGAVCFFDGDRFEIAGIPASCIDATAAGDAFWAGFLSSLLRDGITRADEIGREALEKAVRYGNASGSICVRSKGAIATLPTIEAIEIELGGAQG